jgi:phage major head subunit gpT-like protein
MQMISEESYKGLNANTWWRQVAVERTTDASEDTLIWPLDSAQIRQTIKGGGQMTFDDIVSQKTVIESTHAVAGLKLTRDQLDDSNGRGAALAAHWSKGVGAYAAYWPQKLLASGIIANPTAYTGVSFFNASHPVNPYDSAAGTYSNLRAAVPIGGATTVDAALANLATVTAGISVIPTATGTDPRRLRAKYLFVPPALAARAAQLTDAKFIAQAASSGGGSGDVQAVIKTIGLLQPIVCEELAAAFGGSDSSYYIGCEEITMGELGAWVYLNREPFAIIYHGEMTDAQIARTREYQWTTEGRNAIQPGHPYLMHKCTV